MTLESFETVAAIKAERDVLRKQVSWCKWDSECPRSHENMVGIKAENEQLRNDYASKITECGSLRDDSETLRAENERYREALDKIADPVKYLQLQAEQAGGALDGRVATELSRDPWFLREIAEKALEVAGE